MQEHEDAVIHWLPLLQQKLPLPEQCWDLYANSYDIDGSDVDLGGEDSDADGEPNEQKPASPEPRRHRLSSSLSKMMLAATRRRSVMDKPASEAASV